MKTICTCKLLEEIAWAETPLSNKTTKKRGVKSLNRTATKKDAREE